MSSIAAQKRLLRTEAAKRRDAAAASNDIGEKLIEVFNEAYAPPRKAAISAYYPIGSEANILPLLELLRNRGYEVLLPVVLEPKKPLVFRQWLASTVMCKGPYGIQEPGPDSKSVQPDLILVPLLAFDGYGNRLGYGGGFYDLSIKSIRENQPATAVGIAYAAQQIPAVPHDAYDTPLDRIITEDGAITPESGPQ